MPHFPVDDLVCFAQLFTLSSLPTDLYDFWPDQKFTLSYSSRNFLFTDLQQLKSLYQFRLPSFMFHIES